MKRFLLTAIFILITSTTFAQQQPVVAVAPFDVISGVSSEDASMITDVFFVRLGNTKKVDLVNRSIVQRVIKEHNFQLEDWSDKDKTAELGKALNADWIVQGDIRKMNNGILIIVQFYNIKTFKFEGGTDLRLANADEAYEKMDPLVDNLIQTIGGTGTDGNTGGKTGISFLGDTLGMREQQTIISGLREALQTRKINLVIDEKTNAATGYCFTITVYYEKVTTNGSNLLKADVTAAFILNGKILLQSAPYYITETNETMIARRISERLRADQAFFNKIIEIVR